MLPSREFWRAFVMIVAGGACAAVAGVWVCGSPPLAAGSSEWLGWCWRVTGVLVVIVVLAAWLARSYVQRVVVPVNEITVAVDRFLASDRNATEPARLSPSSAEAFPRRLVSAYEAMSRRATARIIELERWRDSLDQNNQQLAIVLEAMVEGVIAVDAQERILLANGAAIRMLDLKPTGLTGRRLWEAVRLPKFQELVIQALESGEQQRIEIDVPRTQSVLAAVMSRLPGELNSGAVLVLHDVTDLRRLESLRHDFVSNVSHELKTPLAAISAYSEILLDGALEDSDNNRSFVTRIGEQADRLHTLILELLELARMESDEPAFDLTAIDVSEILNECIDEHQNVAKSKSLLLETQAPTDPLWGLADEESLRTVADNLLDNAINYTPSGGRIVVRWKRDVDGIVIEIEDNGVGIAKENQARIFERFFRVDKARSREVGGTGLGLSIVKHHCQVFGGQVRVTSQLGKGSTFTVRLRAAEPPS